MRHYGREYDGARFRGGPWPRGPAPRAWWGGTRPTRGSWSARYDRSYRGGYDVDLRDRFRRGWHEVARVARRWTGPRRGYDRRW